MIEFRQAAAAVLIFGAAFSIGAVAAPRAPRPAVVVLDPSLPSAQKIKLTSVNAEGNCPSGATKIEKCSGTYPNGNSWEMSPCCRQVID
jgi:hypothetical protein